MKSAIIAILVGLCVWFASTWIPSPSEIFNPHSNNVSNVIEKPAPAITTEPQKPPQQIVPPPPIQIPQLTITEAETQLFNLINAERQKAKLDPLSWSDYWQQKARRHSEYMAKTGNFEHSDFNCYENIMYSPWGRTLTEFPELTIKGWMDSPGHKANLLNLYIRICGIGIAQKDDTLYATFMAN